MAFSKFRTPSNRRTLGIFLAVTVLLICLCSAVYFLDPYRLNIAPGVTVDGVDLSGKSPLAAKQTIEQALTDTLYLKTLQVRLPQETLSLSERFGLRVLFAKPEKKLYLEIVHELASRRGIDIPHAQLDVMAEAFVLRHGYRSARCAEQFVDSLT